MQHIWGDSNCLVSTLGSDSAVTTVFVIGARLLLALILQESLILISHASKQRSRMIAPSSELKGVVAWDPLQQNQCCDQSQNLNIEESRTDR